MPRHTGGATPYKFGRNFTGSDAPGWMISYGKSALLVAQGSTWSRVEGLKIFRDLEDRYWKRKRSDKKIKRRVVKRG